MSFIWHGFNHDKSLRETQCYSEWHCFICWLRVLFLILSLGVKYRIGRD